MKCWVDVLVPGRHVERFRLPELGATLGCGRQADIRVQGVPGILSVHLSLRPSQEGCVVELEPTAHEPFAYQGMPSRGCVAAWGQDLFIGSMRLTVVGDGRAAGMAKQSPVLWVALVAVPLLVAMAFFSPEKRGGEDANQSEAPALFGQMPACSESREGAVGRGLVAEQLALSKHERGVFELKDSVDAVELMREAAACYALGDNQGASDRALDRSEDWIADLQFGYKRALLDLEISKRAGAGKQALDAIKRLQVMLSRADSAAGSYKQQLSQLRLSVIAALEEERRQQEEN
jgi:hypothetical protein